MVQQLSTNTFGVAKWVVSPLLSDGTHTTISAAITSASSGDTIFVRDGTYTENPTLKGGITIVGLGGDGLNPNVILNGTLTANFAGTATISNICLQTNSAPFLSVTGTAATVINLDNCFLNCTNNTGISSSSSSSSIFLRHCISNLATTGIGLFTISGAGGMDIESCYLNNSGGSTTASTTSSALVTIKHSFCNIVFSTTSGGSMNAWHCNFEVSGSTPFTSAGTGVPVFNFCEFGGGTASALSIGAGTTVNMYNCRADSSNTNAITGAGTLLYTPITFTGNSHTVNVTTQTPKSFGPDLLNANQPCVTAIVNANTTNNTGDGTSYTVIFNTVLFDQSSNFNTGTGTFTAPYTQKYLFTSAVRLNNLLAAHTSGNLQLISSGNSYFLDQINVGVVKDVSSVAMLNGSAIVAMTAGDTATIVVNVSGSTKTVGISGDNASPFISFVSIYALP
jgi:C1q domain-containing protein